MTKKKVDLGRIFKAINTNDFDFYKEVKGNTSPWVLMRWASLSSTNSMLHIYFTNELVNKHFSSCADHEKLQWMSIALVGNGPSQYRWVPPPKKKKSNKRNKYSDMINDIHPDWKDSEVHTFINMNTEDDLKDYLEQNGKEII